MNNETGFIEQLDNNTADKHTMIMFSSSADSSTGYGKPPKHTQFKKGKSGNPKGRPPKKVLQQVVSDVLNEMVTITMNGQKVEMTKKEAVIQMLLNDSMKGKSPQTRNLLILLRTLDQIWPM